MHLFMSSWLLLASAKFSIAGVRQGDSTAGCYFHLIATVNYSNALQEVTCPCYCLVP